MLHDVFVIKPPMRGQEFQVFTNRKVREKHWVCHPRDAADTSPASGVSIPDAHCASDRLQFSGDRLEQGRLPGAVWPRDHIHLAAVKGAPHFPECDTPMSKRAINVNITFHGVDFTCYWRTASGRSLAHRVVGNRSFLPGCSTSR